MKKPVCLLLCLCMAIALLSGAALAAEMPNRLRMVELSMDEPVQGKTPPSVTVTAVTPVRGTAQVTVEKEEWSGDLDANGCFQGGSSKKYDLTVGLRITGCSDESDRPWFVPNGEGIWDPAYCQLHAGDYTTSGSISLQPTGDKQYIEFKIQLPGHAVTSAQEALDRENKGDTQKAVEAVGAPGRVLAALREDKLISNTTAAAGKSGFVDVKDGDYFAQPVIWATGKKITQGTSGNTFSPGKTCTRGQIVTFLYRANQNK